MSCTCCRLDRIESALAAMLAKLDTAGSHQHQILERLKAMANQIDQLRDDLRTNTDAVAARLDTLIAQITADADNTASPATLADLKVISDHLKAMGTNPSNPVPALPPAPTV